MARRVCNVIFISIMAEREKPANAAKSKPKKSMYIETLSGEALARYEKKLELIDGVDPYQINKKTGVQTKRNYLQSRIQICSLTSCLLQAHIQKRI